MSHLSRRTRCTRRAGFTLVELLAAMAILSLLVGLSLTLVSRAKATANENACQQQLRDIAGILTNWVEHRNSGKWPREAGPKLLLMTVKEGSDTGEALKKYVCPGTDDVTWDPNDLSKKIGSGLTDWDNLNYDCISYAGRDLKTAAVRKDKLDNEVLAADDNWFAGAGRPNHGGIVNIVYFDGHISIKKLSDYKDQLPEGQDWLPVGPDSPDEDLKKLLFE
jgi:prepilin-type N-terminal cleavage/methylation domain-containing protein/prepilin-type processing-associated H-X9-DG protein